MRNWTLLWLSLTSLAILLVGSVRVAAHPSTPKTEPSLARVPAPPPNPLKLDENSEEPECSQIAKRVARIRTQMNDHQVAVGSFVDDISALMRGWYKTLKPFENQSTTIPTNTFSPIKSGAEDITEVLNLIYDNGSYIDRQLELVQTALTKCLNQSTNTDQRR